MRGSITFPDRVDPSKVVVFVHGRHAVCIGSPPQGSYVCPDAATDDGTPTSTDIRSHGGYDYLADNLASHGYAVMSIEANVSNFDNGYSDAGANVRSQIIQASLGLLNRWNNGKGPVLDDPDTTVGTKLVGRLELSNGIGLMGHSRGGDAVTDFVTYNRNLPANSRTLLSGVLALAPTYFTNTGRTASGTDPAGAPRTPEGTNFATLLPACDGDVSNLQGARFFENAKYAAGNAAVANFQWYVQGTNHNFFNTVWTGDDFQSRTDPACSRAPGTTKRLTPSDQRRVGLGLMNAFLRRYVGNETGFDPIMTGSTTLPAAAAAKESGVPASEEVKTSCVGPKAGRLDVLHPRPLPDLQDLTGQTADPADLTTDAAGGPIAAAGLSTFEVCRPPAPPGRGGTAVTGPYPACPAAGAVANRSIGTQYGVAWDSPASLTAALGADGATRDVSRYGVLDLRAGVNRSDARNPAGDGIDPAAASQDFDVTVTDSRGRTATTNARRWMTSLEPSIGTVFQHVVLNGIRIPMSAFPGVDLTKVASVTLGFGTRTPKGSIVLSDVMFQEMATPAAVTPTIPPKDGPTSPQGTLVGTPAQIGTGSPLPATPGTSSTKACTDTKAPTTRRALTSLRRTRIRIIGRAADAGCAGARGKAAGGVRRTAVQVYKRSGRRCRFVNAKGRLAKRATTCSQPVLVYAKGQKRGRSRSAGRSSRHRPESNRCTRLCRPLRSHSATVPGRRNLARGAAAGRSRGPGSASARPRDAPRERVATMALPPRTISSAG